ncbi:uncharacterized protein LOC132950285 isoform X3 [Metopolophium dirhodum]|uniref:uncharacterized protein LOC132950285 isoform X3 n=1 Tax=Metopolophium dirhodum TaxID=44670 RepID=UPI00298F4EE2|nr:uncharacterized protein LOC132950285 isoform X3 [Metopolophium dirhodum]
MEWYREQTIQLIDLFRNRPALWDTSSVHYRNKRMKNESLEQISVKLKCPKEEIAKKICTLRVQFSRENVKVKRARESGGTVYNPKWFGYQLLCFLNDQSRYTSQPINNCSPGVATAPGASGAMLSGMVAQNQADAENQHFNWSQTSEDSYAEANDTNASGYEADSVLASMMHESMDDYHNQEPIVDVQEPQTWSSCRKYRGMQPVTGGDYSDDDGGGYSSRKMMRMSRPDAPSDEFNTFSDYVAERMRNLKADKALQLMARRDIEQVLFKYEMKLLEQKRDSQQHQQPDTEAATTSKSISPSPVSDLEQQ